MSNEIRFVEGEFQRVVIRPDDVIVLSYPGVLSLNAYDNIQKMGEKTFPDHKVIVLTERMTIGAIGKEIF